MRRDPLTLVAREEDNREFNRAAPGHPARRPRGGPILLPLAIPARAATRRLLGLALLGLVLLVPLGPRAARASWMIPPAPWRAKDFALVKRDGLYHVFYTRTNRTDPLAPTETAFGHAVSADLYNWTQLDSVLPVRPNGWDNLHVWAPSILKSGPVYYMYYTGVEDHPGGPKFHQSIGLATSTDLMQWNRLDVPVFTCDQVPWSFCEESRPTGGNFRDPFVMPDPALPGSSLMYYTTVAETDTNLFIVGLARSSGNPAQWTDVKPMDVTYRPVTGWDLAESPHVFDHWGVWHLFFTTNAPEPIVWATGADPTADPSGWTYHGSLADQLGFSTRFWFASEHLRDGIRDYFAFVNFDRVDTREMLWLPNGSFVLTQPELFHVTKLSWSRDSVETGWEDTLTVRAVNAAGLRAHFAVSYIDSVTGNEVPIDPVTVGLPDSLAIPDTLATFVWAAQRHRDGAGTPDPSSRFIVRTTDWTAGAPPLYVGPPGSCSGGGGDTGGGEILDPARMHPVRPQLRALERTPVSAGPALLIELPAAMPVRLEMFDLQGRRLELLADRTLPSGATVVPWEAAARHAVARGIFFARLTTPAGVTWVRVPVLR